MKTMQMTKICSEEIVMLFQQQPSIKWKMLNAVLSTVSDRSLYYIEYDQKNDRISVNSKLILEPKDIVIQCFEPCSVNQGAMETITGILDQVPAIKAALSSSKWHLASGITAIVAGLYSLIRLYDDPINWALQLTSIVSSIFSMIISLNIQKKFSITNIVESNPLTTDVIKAAVEGILDIKVEESVSTDEEEKCYHNSQDAAIWTRAQIEAAKLVNTLREHTSRGFTTIGEGPFLGCCRLLPTKSTDLEEDLYEFYGPDCNQMSIDTMSPIFTSVLSLIYVLGTAALTATGLSTTRQLLDFARLKNEMKTSIRDVKDFIKFVAEDLLEIATSTEKAAMKALSDQHEVNHQLLTCPLVDYVQCPTKFAELTAAVKTSKLLLETSKTSPDSHRNDITDSVIV